MTSRPVQPGLAPTELVLVANTPVASQPACYIEEKMGSRPPRIKCQGLDRPTEVVHPSDSLTRQLTHSGC